MFKKSTYDRALHPPLRQGPLDQSLHITSRKSQRPQPPRLIAQFDQKPSYSLTQHISSTFSLHVTGINTKEFCRPQMMFRITWRGEAEHGQSRDGDRDAMQDERMRDLVAQISTTTRIEIGNRVTHPMTDGHLHFQTRFRRGLQRGAFSIGRWRCLDHVRPGEGNG